MDLALGVSRIVVRAVDAQGRQASTTFFTTRLREVSPLDLRPDAPPLQVRKAPSDALTLVWEELAAARYAVSAGTLASLHERSIYDHVPVSCGVVDPFVTLPALAGNRYFLVTESCKFAVGPAGRNSLGGERPQRATGCR